VRKDLLTTRGIALSCTELPEGQEKAIRVFNKGKGGSEEQEKKMLGDLKGRTQSAISRGYKQGYFFIC